MEKPTYEELEAQLKQAKEEIAKLVKENAALQSKILEMQFMIKNYIMND